MKPGHAAPVAAISAASIVARRGTLQAGGRPGALPPRAAVIASICAARAHGGAPWPQRRAVSSRRPSRRPDLRAHAVLSRSASRPSRHSRRSSAAGSGDAALRRGDAAAAARLRRRLVGVGHPGQSTTRHTLHVSTAALLYRSAAWEAITRVGVVGLGTMGRASLRRRGKAAANGCCR